MATSFLVGVLVGLALPAIWRQLARYVVGRREGHGRIAMRSAERISMLIKDGHL